MGCSVVQKRDLAIGHGMRVYHHGTHAAARACGVLHDDMVERGAVAVGKLVARPIRRDARVDPHTVPSLVEAEDRLEADAIQPAGRARVPSPATPPCMW